MGHTGIRITDVGYPRMKTAGDRVSGDGIKQENTVTVPPARRSGRRNED